MSTAEEFILIPKNQFMEKQPYPSQKLKDLRVHHAVAQFLFLNRMRPNEDTDKENQEILDISETTDSTELPRLHADNIF